MDVRTSYAAFAGVTILTVAYHEWKIRKLHSILDRTLDVIHDHLEDHQQQYVDRVFEEIADNLED